MEDWVLIVLLLAPLVLLLVFGATKIVARVWFAAKREHTRQLLRELSDDDHHH